MCNFVVFGVKPIMQHKNKYKRLLGWLRCAKLSQFSICRHHYPTLHHHLMQLDNDRLRTRKINTSPLLLHLSTQTQRSAKRSVFHLQNNSTDILGAQKKRENDVFCKWTDDDDHGHHLPLVVGSLGEFRLIDGIIKSYSWPPEKERDIWE